MPTLSSLLRKIRRKFAPSDASPLLRDSAIKSGYFSQRKGGRQGSHDRSNAENRLLEKDPWPQRKCEEAILTIGDNSYIQKPFETRAERAELV